MKIVSVSNITKSYKGVQALRGISFEVDKGEIFGIVGPDGAGKTSLFRILTTLWLADSGTAVVDGNDVITEYKKIRRKVGYMPGRFSLYQDLTVEENLHIFATLFGTTIKENYFYTEWVDDNDTAYARMLYDHAVDPGENVNISEFPENSSIIEQMSLEMRRSRTENYFQK